MEPAKHLKEEVMINILFQPAAVKFPLHCGMSATPLRTNISSTLRTLFQPAAGFLAADCGKNFQSAAEDGQFFSAWRANTAWAGVFARQRLCITKLPAVGWKRICTGQADARSCLEMKHLPDPSSATAKSPQPAGN